MRAGEGRAVKHQERILVSGSLRPKRSQALRFMWEVGAQRVVVQL